MWLGERLGPLTRKEFDLLVLPASDPGTVLSRGRIMSKVWQDASPVPSRTIDTHVGTLRAKLGSRSWIVTVHGVGVRLGHAWTGLSWKRCTTKTRC
ncbi:winged helix-turn-helix domain-containing protein [Amycolatopsis sp.]|uniref:winged helix-turn-helix domain-containing protein n=1 Tax=Amycolatopsis sp. TaxID=37632 RepID=UPI0039C89B55